ncbi:MAG: hypothetical protein H6538_05000 [Bacteroidales bacterium]|nr:hypothetical protein [Bacteroidales bacterium]MCB8998865.1 hypothetical protein [Bacteroidales bacterium]MCB9013996.1 hypothetical protein [Bacteroidales bacterium]
MKKFGFLFLAVALFGLISLGSCKPKATEPAESTEQVETAPAATDEAAPATDEAAPAEDAPAEAPAN